MKKMRMLSGLMAMTMTALSVGMIANAADIGVTIGKDEQDPGAKFSVNVDLSGVPASGITSVDFAINYDSSVITVEDVTLGEVGQTGADAQEGDLADTLFSTNITDDQVVIIWATGTTDSQYWINKEGTFLTITGTVNADAKPGDVSKLTGGPVARDSYPGGAPNESVVFAAVGENNEVTDYTAVFTDGSVTVKGGSTDTTGDWGNVNESAENGEDRVTIADAILLSRATANGSTVTLTDQAQINADVTHDNAVDANDVTKLLNYLSEQISYDDLATA